MEIVSPVKDKHITEFFTQVKNKSDVMMNYFLAAYFIIGLLLAFYYDTWLIAIGVGGLSLLAYYSTKALLKDSDLYQYVLSTVLGIFMAQFIYQMHGLFEMHFFAFVGSAILISYQNWRLQIPLALVVIVHHAVFGYLQFIGFDEIYFTQLEYMTLQTFIIHGILATAIFLLSGLWAYNFRLRSYNHIVQSYEIGKLQEADKQKEKLLAIGADLQKSNERLKEAQQIARVGNWEYDGKTNKLSYSEEIYRMLEFISGETVINFQTFINLLPPEHRDELAVLTKKCISQGEQFSLETMVNTMKGNQLTVNIQAKAIYFEGSEAPTVIGIIQDVTARKMAEAERERMVADMFQRTKDLEQFTYIISHNLRGPVSNILGFSEVLKEDDITDEERTKYVEALSSSVHKLDGVIRDLTHILQVKTEVSEMKEMVNLVDLVNDIKISIKNMIESENVRIESDFSEVDKMLTLKSYMYSIFYNLISNSIKYRQPEVSPIIKIKSRKADNKIVLTFKDNGMGIDLAKKGPQVFGLYKRFHHSVSEGKGMGLYMTKAQVETLNGRIGISSEVNVGTEFKIEFNA